MLSNCILSMSTTFPLLLLPPVSLSLCFFYSCLPHISLFVCSCPLTRRLLHSLSEAWVCAVCVHVWNEGGKTSIYRTGFTMRRILCLGVKASECGLDCPFARSICRCFSCISLCAQCPYFCVVSQHCCICQESINVEAMSLPLPWVDWFAVNEWAHEREGIVGHASLDGGGSFKAPVEQKEERGDPERA